METQTHNSLKKGEERRKF